MDKILDDNPVAKRLFLGLLAGAAVAFNTHFNLGISENEALGILALAGAMITGSNIKEMHLEGKKIDAATPTLEAAMAVVAAQPDPATVKP